MFDQSIERPVNSVNSDYREQPDDLPSRMKNTEFTAFLGTIMTNEKISSAELELADGRHATIVGVRTLEKNDQFKITHEGRSGYLNPRQFVSRVGEAREALADQGVFITADGDWRAIRDAIPAINDFRPALLLEHPGWTGSYFAQGNQKVYAPSAGPKPKAIFPRDAKMAASKGSYIKWRSQIAKPLTGQNTPMIAVLAGLASSLLRFTGENLNFGFEFSGPPATGKTTCLLLMASTTRHPSQLPTFNTTIAGFEDMFEAHNDSPFVCDEANLSDGTLGYMQDFAFRFANGTPKVTRYQPNRARYRFIFATSANTPFHSNLNANSAFAANAALQRLIPISIREDNDLGVFDHLPAGFASSGEFAANLTDAIANQYGTPMRRMLKNLVNENEADEKLLKERIQRKIHEFEIVVGVAATTQGKSRVSSAIGLLYAAGSLAQAWRILPKEWDCMAACVAAFRNYQDQLPSQTPLLVRLLSIAKRSETLDLRTSNVTKLSDEQVEAAGAFLRLGTGSKVELLVTQTVKDIHFPDWSQISQKSEFKLLNRRDKDHATKQRQIREGCKKERFLCFRLPLDLVEQI